MFSHGDIINANGTQASRLRSATEESSNAPATAGETPAYHCRKYLPHIENQPLQFITFRLYDSLPKEVIERFKAYKDALTHEESDKEQQRQLLILLDKYEDSGYGQCFLRDERIAQIVQEALLRSHGEQYELVQWCIMPNHVHVLIRVMPDISLSTILHGWRSFTSHEANKLLGRRGQFWMHEYFDRYIRDTDHFNKTVNYIRNNPVKAGLTTDPDLWRWTGDGTQASRLRKAPSQSPQGTQASRLRSATEESSNAHATAGETPAYHSNQ